MSPTSDNVRYQRLFRRIEQNDFSEHQKFASDYQICVKSILHE